MNKVVTTTINDFSTSSKIDLLRVLEYASVSDINDLVIFENFYEGSDTFSDVLDLVSVCKFVPNITSHIILDVDTRNSLSFSDIKCLKSVAGCVDLVPSDTFVVGNGDEQLTFSSALLTGNRDDFLFVKSQFKDSKGHIVFGNDKGEIIVGSDFDSSISYRDVVSPSSSYLGSIYYAEEGLPLSRYGIMSERQKELVVRPLPVEAANDKTISMCENYLLGSPTIEVNELPSYNGSATPFVKKLVPNKKPI